MKNKILKTGMVCVMCMMLAACGKADKNVEPTAAPTVTAAPTATEAPTSTPTPEPTATNTPTPEPTATSTPTPEPTEAPVVTDSYVKGIITEDSFESEWMGLRFTVPEGVTMATQEEMDALMRASVEAIYGDNAEEMLDYTAMQLVSEMQAVWPEGFLNVQVSVEKMPVEWPETTYLSLLASSIVEMYAATEITCDIGEEMYTLELAGQDFFGLATALSAGDGNTIYQDYIVKAKGNRMILIIFSYNDATESYIQEALEAFSAY